MLNCPADVLVVIVIADICVYSAVDNGGPRPGARWAQWWQVSCWRQHLVTSESPPPRAGDGNSRVASACLNITDGLKPPFGYDLCEQESQFHIYLLCLNAHLAYYFIICGSARRGPSPGTVKFLKVLLTLIASPPPPPRQQLCPDADFIKLIKFWAVGSSQGGARAGGVWEESHLLFTFTARR